MSKFLKIPNGDYKIQVQNSGNIILDTGFETGQVRITGDLVVEGDTTTVQSENMTVKDNIIVLNEGEAGVGVTLNESGLRIDRGALVDTFMVFDEDLTWTDPATATLKTGAFVFKDQNGGAIGLRCTSISTGGGDLYLINRSNGVISVTGTTNYENNVTDDDHIPNKKYVDDEIINAFATVFQARIGEGVVDPSFVEVKDNEDTTLPSVIEFGIDNNIVAEFYGNRLELNDLRIEGTKIETINSNEDLILSTPGDGVVRVQDVLEISGTPSIDDPDQDLAALGVQYEPNYPGDGIRLYVKDRDHGGTGVFFKHQDQTRGELISNNRSIVYSMIF